jgi:RNA polymerase sigma factor (sigma-70 family)
MARCPAWGAGGLAGLPCQDSGKKMAHNLGAIQRMGWREASVEQESEFSDLFRTEYPALVRAIYLIVGDREHARDIAQEAFLQLFKRWWRVSRYERPDAWVRRVAVRMAVRASRRDQTRRHLEHLTDPAPSQPASTSDIDVLRAVAQLPGMQRAAVILFYFEDRPVAEIAEALACSEATARVHLYRARKRLAEVLGEEESSLDEP